MDFNNIEWYEFEKLVADLWEKLGYETKVTSSRKDGGVDVIATRNQPYTERILIQVKKYSVENTIGVKQIREYSSLLHRSNVDGVVIVTSSSFTAQASKEAVEIGVKLVDRHVVRDLIYQHLPESDFLNPEIPDTDYTDKESLRKKDLTTESIEEETVPNPNDNPHVPKITIDDPLPDVDISPQVHDAIKNHIINDTKYVNFYKDENSPPLYRYICQFHNIYLNEDIKREDIIELYTEFNLNIVADSKGQVSGCWKKYWDSKSPKVSIEHDSILATRFLLEVYGTTNDIIIKQELNEE